MLSPSGLTPLVDRPVRKSLVERERSERDARVVLSRRDLALSWYDYLFCAAPWALQRLSNRIADTEWHHGLPARLG